MNTDHDPLAVTLEKPGDSPHEAPAPRHWLEGALLRTAIGLACALLLLLHLGVSRAIPVTVIQTCGAILIYLSATTMMAAVAYGIIILRKR